MPVVVDDRAAFGLRVPVLVIGAGACGLVAALAARDAGAGVLFLQRDASPFGSTALSSGFVPAAGTRFQRAAGVTDSAELLAADVRRKNHGEADPAVVDAVARVSAPAIEWLADRAVHAPHGVPEGGCTSIGRRACSERMGRRFRTSLPAAARRAAFPALTSGATCPETACSRRSRWAGSRARARRRPPDPCPRKV